MTKPSPVKGPAQSGQNSSSGGGIFASGVFRNDGSLNSMALPPGFVGNKDYTGKYAGLNIDIWNDGKPMGSEKTRHVPGEADDWGANWADQGGDAGGDTGGDSGGDEEVEYSFL